MPDNFVRLPFRISIFQRDTRTGKIVNDSTGQPIISQQFTEIMSQVYEDANMVSILEALQAFDTGRNPAASPMIDLFTVIDSPRVITQECQDLSSLMNRCNSLQSQCDELRELIHTNRRVTAKEDGLGCLAADRRTTGDDTDLMLALLHNRRRVNRPVYSFIQIDDVTIENTTAVTTIIGTGRPGDSLTLPANILTVGKTFLFRVRGYISAKNTHTSTITFKLGGTTIVSSTGTWGTDLTDVGFETDLVFTCRSIGATGTIIGQGRSLISAGAGVSTVAMRALTLTAPVNIDTTVDNVIDITYQWGTASADDSVTITNLYIREG